TAFAWVLRLSMVFDRNCAWPIAAFSPAAGSADAGGSAVQTGAALSDGAGAEPPSATSALIGHARFVFGMGVASTLNDIGFTLLLVGLICKTGAKLSVKAGADYLGGRAIRNYFSDWSVRLSMRIVPRRRPACS